MIVSLLALILRFALLAVLTFAFVVLFEHGPTDYLTAAQSEWKVLVESLSAPAPAPAPARGA